MMGKTAAPYQEPRQWRLAVVVFFSTKLAVKNKPILHKNALEAVKIIKVIKSGPLSTCLFSIL